MTPRAWFTSELQRYWNSIEHTCSHPRKDYIETAKSVGLLIAGAIVVAVCIGYADQIDALGRMIPRWAWFVAVLLWIFLEVHAYTTSVDARFRQLEDRVRQQSRN